MREFTDEELRRDFEETIDSAKRDKLPEFHMRIYHLNQHVIDQVCKERGITYDTETQEDGRIFGTFYLTKK